MKPLIPTILLGIIGLLAGYGFPRTTTDHPSNASPRRSPRQAGAHERTWATTSLSFVNHAATLTPEEWPAFFQARMNNSEGTRLAERLWAEQDPAGFWDWLKLQHDGTALKTYGKDLLQVWALADPDAAMRAANAITDKNSSDFLRRAVVDAVIATDLKKGLELAAAARDFNRFSWGPREWITKDPAAAVQGLAGLPEGSEYRDYLKYAVADWAKIDSPAMLDWLKTQPVHDRDEWFGVAFKAAATADSRAALGAATALEDPAARDAAIAGVLASGVIPSSEMTTLLEHLTLPKRAEATVAALNAMPLKDEAQFADATRLLVEAPANRNTLNATEHVVRRFQDWNQGLAWAITLPDAALRRRALAALAFTAQAEHLDALAATVATAPALNLSNELFRNILQALPDEREAEWMARLPPERAAWARTVAESAKP